MVKQAQRVCEVCGTPINPYTIYCSTCGLRIAEDKGRPTFEDDLAAAFYSANEKKISACLLVKLPLLTRDLINDQIWKGEIEIEFCGCSACQQIYREFIAEANFLLHDGPTDPHCKEIVTMAYNRDIKGLRLNVKDYYSHDFAPKYYRRKLTI
jgi:hypothetical protein